MRQAPVCHYICTQPGWVGFNLLTGLKCWEARMAKEAKEPKPSGRRAGTGPRRSRRDGAADVKVPENKPGNTKSDQAWLDAQVEAGLIEPVDPTDDDTPFGAMKRWTGQTGDVGAFWQLPPEDRRCTAKAKIRDAEGRVVIDSDNNPVYRPCAGWAILGGKVCVRHGGGIERVRAAAQLRLAGAADRLIGELIAIALDAEEEGKTRVQAINSALDRAGIKTGTDVKVELPGWQKVLQDAWGDDEPGE